MGFCMLRLMQWLQYFINKQWLWHYVHVCMSPLWCPIVFEKLHNAKHFKMIFLHKNVSHSLTPTFSLCIFFRKLCSMFFCFSVDRKSFIEFFSSKSRLFRLLHKQKQKEKQKRKNEWRKKKLLKCDNDEKKVY